MEEIYLYKEKVEQMEQILDELGVSLDLEGLKEKIVKLELETYKEDFWQNVDKAQKIMQELKGLNKKVEEYENLKKSVEDLKVLIELAIEEEDYQVYKEIETHYDSISEEVETFKLSVLLNGPYDKNNAILSIHSGAGGLEAQDWAEMLFRMYKRWADRKGFKVEILDYIPDTEGGIKSVTMLIKGFNAYGYLKSEKGVHRLVRISPFDASNRRHTSFASIDVYPELDDEIEVEINEGDLKIDTYRASGAGGQHVNTTDSAVRITHVPTGIMVQCQNERSQHSNKMTAMRMLKAKLIQLKEEEKKEKIEDLQGEYTQIAWGSQIRSYIFHPYSMVKDHRTNVEVGDINRVMDGDIDVFINEYLKQKTL
ncbi:peptide chain release factor 2 [Keratinibaculum paraultunense]|uniref:peptide chain release factor 2 n=1 Tax=Keratinibaculum paraultunense TaxID=1278232 RepID=UPI00192C5D02|nr:peptide chain release factor 2 [Keratinibaculum paraultunense]QQY80087.1 peptide chain release factor 2 [Keratinibaculum paraultunense]